MKIQTLEIKFKNDFARMLLNLTSIFASRRCQGRLRCLEFCLDKESFKNVKNTYADIIISCGAGTTAANIFLKYENNAKNIVIMKPGFGRNRKFDLIILPRHDTPRTTDNILITDGAPNKIRVASGESRITKNGIGLLIGGDAKGFRLKKEDVEKIADEIIGLSEEKNLDIFVSTSRRTSPEIDRLLNEKFRGNKHCKLLIIANEKNAEGAVAGIFGSSDIIIISPESMSMISEAASSGKYVVVFMGHQDTRAPGRQTKYEKLVGNFEKEGYIKTARPDEIYDKMKYILETRPGIKRLDDRKRIIERLKGIV